MIMNRKPLLRKAPRRGRIVALIAVAMSVLLLTGSIAAIATVMVDVTVEHWYYDNITGDYVLGEKDNTKLPEGVYVIDELKEVLATQGSDLNWEFIPDGSGGSTIELEAGYEYSIKIFYYRLYTVVVILNGGNGNPSGEGRYAADKTVAVNAGTRAGYTFSGWKVNKGGIAAPAGAASTFKMPAADVTIEAIWTLSGTGGQETPPPTEPPPTEPPPTEPPPTEPPPTEPPPTEPPPTEPPPAPPPPRPPGGTDQEMPPAPTTTGNTIIPGDNGVFIEFDDLGVPLGEWSWDDVEEMWVFDEYPPLAMMPTTGNADIVGSLAVLWSISLAGLGAVIGAVVKTRARQRALKRLIKLSRVNQKQTIITRRIKNLVLS